MDSTLKNAFNHLSSCPCACVCDDFEKGILACGKKETFNCPVAWPINLSLNSKHQSITLLWHFIMEQPVIWDNHLGQFSNYSTDFTLLISQPPHHWTWQKNLMKSLSLVWPIVNWFTFLQYFTPLRIWYWLGKKSC